MKKIYTIFIVVALICPQAFSATKTIVCETQGRGINREEAIKKALHQAVAQAKGVKVGSGRYEFGFHSATADIEKKETGKAVDFDAVSVQTEGTALRTDIEGLVKTYKVLDEKKIDDNTYEVTLKVWVFDYESTDKTTRVKLAVMPIRTLRGLYQFGELRMSSWDTSRQLSQKLATALTGTNKFTVLDREYIQEFARERNMLLSGDASLEENAKLGQVLGVDYMLVGTITEAGLEKKEKISPAIGYPITEYEADFNFEYRLIIGPTRQLKLAETVDISLETGEVKKLVRKWEPKDLDYSELTDNLISKVANQAVETIIDSLYPIRIASIDKNGQIIINQGGKRISKGLVLEVFTEGNEIIDSDTKESLGKTEILVATIQVDKVMPKFSYAKLVKGDLAKISEGLICRYPKTEAKPVQEGFKSNIKTTPEGGVKLPFDHPR
jgi:hypothetical protein